MMRYLKTDQSNGGWTLVGYTAEAWLPLTFMHMFYWYTLYIGIILSCELAPLP